MAYTRGQLENIVIAAANKYGVPPQIGLAIAQHESGWNPAINNAGLNAKVSGGKNTTTDWGLMQLNDLVLQTYGITKEQALDPVTNADAAMRLFKSNLDRFGGDVDKAVWAYAAGPGNVKGTPPSSITSYQAYVKDYKPSSSTGYDSYANAFPSDTPGWEPSGSSGGGGGAVEPSGGSGGADGDWEGSDGPMFSMAIDFEDPATMAVLALLAIGAWVAFK